MAYERYFRSQLLDPVDKPSVAESVFRSLREKILLGEFAPGDALPGERALSKSLGVNRGAVRESLKKLEHSGLVEIQHGERTRVRDFRRDGGVELLGDLIVHRDGSIDLQALRSMLQIAMMVRIAVVRDLAQRGSEVGSALVEELEKFRTARTDVQATIAARNAFWGALFDASGDAAHRMLFNSLNKLLVPLTHVLEKVAPPEDDDAEMKVIERLIEVVVAGDPDAAEQAVRETDATIAAPILAKITEQIDRGESMVIPELAKS